MHRLRDHAFAGAMLAGDQHVGSGWPDASDHFEDRTHRRRIRDHRDAGFGCAQQAVLIFQTLAAAQRRAQLHLRADRADHASVVPRLLDEVTRSAAHRFHHQVHAAPRGHHDHRQCAVHGGDAIQQVQTFLARSGVTGVIQVHQQDVVVLGFEGAEDAAGRSRRVDLEAFALQQQAERFQHVVLIVGDEGSGLHG